jgi:hypothetical protein
VCSGTFFPHITTAAQRQTSGHVRRVTDQFPNANGLLRADASDFSQSGRLSAKDTFDRSEVIEQSVRESGTDARKSLEPEQPS